MSKFRMSIESDYRGKLLRFFWGYSEVAYIVLGPRGPCLNIEFPSDWHELRAGWIRVSLGLITFAIAFPWPWVSKDEGQCSGHQYGLTFFDDVLILNYGKDKGFRKDPTRVFYMPWSWRHIATHEIAECGTFPYTYVLKSGEVQNRTATVEEKIAYYWRPWIPFSKYWRYADIDFNDEVGERSGSWKGGTIGCSYTIEKGETPEQCLRRMERERKF